MNLPEDLEQLSTGFSHYTRTAVFHPNGNVLLDREGTTHTGYDIVDGQ